MNTATETKSVRRRKNINKKKCEGKSMPRENTVITKSDNCVYVRHRLSVPEHNFASSTNATQKTDSVPEHNSSTTTNAIQKTSDKIVCMKLLLDSQTNRVLCAEAGKDCVDFLFRMLSLPIPTVIRLLEEEGMVGSLGNLYKSVENLDKKYILPGQHKDSVSKPKNVCSVPLLFPECGLEEPHEKLAYKCSNRYCNNPSYYFSDDNDSLCPSCNSKMNIAMCYVAPQGMAKKPCNECGLVEGVVMDDLVISPMSAISSINLLNTFNVKDIGALKEKEVDIGVKEAVKLLKASLHSKTVLTDVFLGNDGERRLESIDMQWFGLYYRAS